MDRNNQQNSDDIYHLQEAVTELKIHAKNSNEEMGKVQVDIAGIKTDLSWLVRFFWIVAGASIGGLVTGVLNLIIQNQK